MSGRAGDGSLARDGGEVGRSARTGREYRPRTAHAPCGMPRWPRCALPCTRYQVLATHYPLRLLTGAPVAPALPPARLPTSFTVPMTKREDALEYHARGRPAKIAVVPTKPLQNQRDLSLA